MDKEEVKLVYKNRGNMIAALLFTKPLLGEVFRMMRDMMCITIWKFIYVDIA
jgi:hypothetical protein